MLRAVFDDSGAGGTSSGGELWSRGKCDTFAISLRQLGLCDKVHYNASNEGEAWRSRKYMIVWIKNIALCRVWADFSLLEQVPVSSSSEEEKNTKMCIVLHEEARRFTGCQPDNISVIDQPMRLMRHEADDKAQGTITSGRQ